MLFLVSVLVVFCFIVGQRFFKVDYDLPNMVLYFVFSLALYFFDFYFFSGNSVLTFLVKLLLLSLFVALFLWRERELRSKINSIILSYGHKGNK